MCADPIAEELVAEAVERYRRERDRYVKLARRVEELCRGALADDAIRSHVTSRSKSPERLAGKLSSLHEKKPEKAAAIQTTDDVFRLIGDLAGVRVTTYEERDRPRAVAAVQAAFAVAQGEVAVKDGAGHYRATHLQVELRGDDLADPDYENLVGTSSEVQICSMLAHVWNEIEHDLQYKPQTGKNISDEETEQLDQLGQITLAGDIAIKRLFEANERRVTGENAPFADVFDFVSRVRGKFDVADFGKNSKQLMRALEELGLNTPRTISEAILAKDSIEPAQSRIQEFNAWLDAQEPETAMRLDPETADILLAMVLEQSAQDIVAKNPLGYGQGRPSRLVWLAYRYEKWKTPRDIVDEEE